MKSKITIMGHAGLYIEAGAERILVDPLLRTSALASGTVVHSYTRELNLEAMPSPTLGVITHGHLDHFDPESLRRLDRRLPLVVPNDPAMQHALRELGFQQLITLNPWETHRADGVALTATPSHAEIDEWGVLFEASEARFLHHADAEPSLEDAQRVRRERGEIDVTSVKFQPASPGHGVLRALGPYFDKRHVLEWLECAAELGAELSFPYASGVQFSGRHAWMNDYAFPFQSNEIAALLSPRLASPPGAESTPTRRVECVLPGDVIEFAPRHAQRFPQASRFVRHVEDGHGEPVWRPFDQATLEGLSSDAEREELEERLEAFLRDEIAPWIAMRRDEEGSPIQSYVKYGVVYQMSVHVGAGQQLNYAIDFRNKLSLTAEWHPEANYFAHLSGRSLLEVLRGNAGPELFYMSGDVRLYEKILWVQNGKFGMPNVRGWDLFERLPEPVTHYLRHTRDAH
ncbi:MAG TPA: MBL fold metallo-hydrolase [Polyangiaceae bacterium]|nr:MBL fold metallo-hydrolase [Polyangiaceae bacterium]